MTFINDNYTLFKSGFEYDVHAEFFGKTNYVSSDSEKREYELMSEAIRQQIAKEVTRYLHDNDIYILEKINMIMILK